MSFAQTSYPQIQGINGRYSIHDIGCFLTSFCNLEGDWNVNIDPLTLNNHFVKYNVYIDVDDGIRDDLDWGFIQTWDASTRVTRIGYGGWPSTNHAIVGFKYYHNNAWNTHFCKVANWTSHAIVDSWDGVTKSVNSTWYGEPVAWAEYEHSDPTTAVITPAAPVDDMAITEYVYSKLPEPLNMRLNKDSGFYDLNFESYDHIVQLDNQPKGNPFVAYGQAARKNLGLTVYYMTENDFGDADTTGHPRFAHGINRDDLELIPVAPKVPLGGLSVPLAETYELVTTVLTFDSAADAANHENAKATKAPGKYIVYGRDLKMINLTDNAVKSGFWINPLDNVPTPVKTPVVETDAGKAAQAAAEKAQQEAEVAARNTNLWKTTNVPVQGEPLICTSTNTEPVAIHDLDQRNKDITLPPKQDLHIVSFFVKDGVEYGRAKKVAEAGKWYGIPTSILETYQYDEPEKFELSIDSLVKLVKNFFKQFK